MAGISRPRELHLKRLIQTEIEVVRIQSVTMAQNEDRELFASSRNETP